MKVFRIMNKFMFVLLFLGASFVYANNDSGFYVGINVGNANTQSNLDINSGNSLTASTNTLAGGLIAGYQFNKFLAVEANYLAISNYDSSTSNELFSASTSAKNSFLTANVKGMLPFTDWFNLFGKVGAGYNFTSASGVATSNVSNHGISLNGDSSNLVPMLGVGVSFNLVGGLSVSLENDYYIVSQQHIDNINSSPSNFGYGNVNYTSVGVQYLF